jgi:hypothetical protein
MKDEVQGTYSELVELSQQREQPKPKPRAPKPDEPKREAFTTPSSEEDLATTPYISQNYRFTEDELRWLRRQSLNLSERLGTKISQNTILRVALQRLRELYSHNPKANPLLEALEKLKK